MIYLNINRRLFQTIRLDSQAKRFISISFSFDYSQEQTVKRRPGRFRKGDQTSRVNIISCNNLPVTFQATEDTVLGCRHIVSIFIHQRYFNKD